MQLNVKRYSSLVFAALSLTACVASSNTSNNSSNTLNTSTSSPSASAEARVPLGDGRVSFIPPANLKPLTKDQIASSKFAKGKPQHVFTDDGQGVYVKITFGSMRLAPDQLSEFKESSERFMSRIDPDAKLLASEIVAMNGKKWVHFEVAGNAPDGDYHYHTYTTSFDGGDLVFGFTSTGKDYPQVKNELISSAQTIQVKD